jgi:hypothetical protein
MKLVPGVKTETLIGPDQDWDMLSNQYIRSIEVCVAKHTCEQKKCTLKLDDQHLGGGDWSRVENPFQLCTG